MTRIIFSLILVIVSFQSFYAQSLNQLNSAGISSEEDLKKLGLSDSEINEMKSQLLNSSNTEIQNDSTDAQTEVNDGFQEIDQIETPMLKLVSEKKENGELEHVFGRTIFTNGAVSIKMNSDRIKAPDSYFLGAGDKINITIWGFSEFSGEYTLDDLGNITPKMVGRVNLKGKSFKVAKSILKSRFSKVYDLKNSQISITLSYSKVISVNVVGEIEKPGTYNIPAINSAFNFLSLAGGPSDLGSVRNIEIRREGKKIDELDVYKFLTFPSKVKPVFLMDGDFIVVKARRNLVKIDTGLNRLGLFEVTKADRFKDLLEYCGGFSANTDKSFIHINRLGSKGREFKTFTLKTVQDTLQFKNGDIISFSKRNDLLHSQVQIEGAINVPGNYELKDGDRISDLIQRAKGVNFESFENRAHVYRLNNALEKTIITFNISDVIKDVNSKENIPLKEFDRIVIFNKSNFVNESSIKISGKVKNPIDVSFYEGITLKDILLMSGGLLPDADKNRIEIERVSFENQPSVSDNYVKIISCSYENADNITLKPKDIIQVRPLPEFSLQETIQIKGEVKYPGSYSLSKKNEKLKEVLERAGGLTDLAFLEGANIYRTEDSLGTLLLNIAEVYKNSSSKFNYVIKAGDIITIPKTPNLVTISGAIGFDFVNTKQSVINSPYQKAKRAKFYIKRYGGGFSNDAKRNEIYVVQINGMVKQSSFFGLRSPKVKNGDLIKVIAKEPKKEKEKRTINWNEQIESLTIKLTGLTTLWVLASRID